MDNPLSFVSPSANGTGPDFTIRQEWRDDVHRQEVDKYKKDQRARDDARREMRQESLTGKMAWEWQAGQDLDRAPTEWRISDLLAVGDTGLLSAQYKAGKTATILEMARALTQGTRGAIPFLGRWDVMPPDGRVAFINMEMRPNQLAGYMPDSLLGNPRIDWHNYRGRAQNMNLLDDAHFERAVKSLNERDIQVMIIDPLQPVFMATGTDSMNNDSVSLLNARLSMLKNETRISELIITHHTGHADRTRGRGASDLMGWADELWNLKLSSPDDPFSIRQFSGKGRDGVPFSVTLSYDRDTRELRADGDEGRMIVTVEDRVKDIIRGMSLDRTPTTVIKNVLADQHRISSKGTVDRAIKELVQAGEMVEERAGKGRALVYSFPPGRERVIPQDGEYS